MICENCGKEFKPKVGTQKNCSPSNTECYIERMRRHSKKTNLVFKLRKKEAAQKALSNV